VAKRGQENASTDELDALYELPLDEFTAERNALAKRLRADGEREEADRIKALPKPSVPAWAINRGVRADPEAAKALLAAGEHLRGAHEAALSGAADPLREAMGREANAIEAMARAAGEAAGDEKLSPAMLDRVRDTLRAVAGDDELRAAFEAGRVERDSKPVGLGGAFSPGTAPKPRPHGKEPTAAERKRAEQRLTKARKTLDGARRRTVKAVGAVDHARRALSDAEADAEEAERQEEAAQAELDEADAAKAELDPN
jgi:hypothetical protein